MINMLNVEMMDNLKFRLDVSVNQSTTSSIVRLNYTDIDRINLTTTESELSIITTELEDGDEKWLYISKPTGCVISFVNEIDISPITDYNDAATILVYWIIRKERVVLQYR